MSFTGDVKTELTNITDMSDICRRAFTYGFLLFGKSFNARSVICTSDYGNVIELFKDSLKATVGVDASVTRLKSGKYVMKVTSAAERKTVIEHFDHSLNEIALRINYGILEEDECFYAFIRGVFLACGTVSDPDKNYHMEFVVPHTKLCMDLIKMLNDLDINAKHIVRKYTNVAYIKESENIEDMLTMMGAINSSLHIMGVKIQKDVRNKINRQMNFESANMNRSIDAGLHQVRAIETIIKKRGLSSLPDELKELARLRLENPDMSLNELGRNLDPPISRSGVNHRFEKIFKIAEQCDE